MKTVIAKFTGDNYANVYDVYQWDYGQVLRIEGLKLPNMVEIHFSLQETSGEAKTRIGVTKDGVTDVVIPDSFLENEGIGDNYKIFVWVYVADKESGSTEYKITIHVKARAKPEITHGGQDGEVFQEAVEAVRGAAKRAAESEKQAEGYAHGREDLPERAEDNAKYYCGKASEDAKKTAEDRKEVERLVESVSGIDEQVTKVEELSKNAQEAATQAGTSAGQAELHKQAAETASSAAQTAAQETEADKVSVEKLSAQVQKNKESVDKTAQDFALNTQQALADVNNAGQAQTERVQTAGTTAVENIKNAQNMATQAVETAKSEAIKAVQAEGTKQTGAVTAEGRKQVQAVQAATQEIIADREQITKNKTDIADLRRNKADAIVENVRGTLLNVKDSANAFFEDFSVYGKSEQVQTTGKNILNIPNIDINTPETVIKCNISEDICISVQEKATVSKSVWRFMALYKNNDKQYITDASLPGVFYATSENPIVSITCRGIMITSGVYRGIMVEYGEAATSYEPYTGGKPSPSPEYPQEIVNAGRLNEDTGKYEVNVKITGKNLFDMNKFIDTCNFTKNEDGTFRIDKFVKRYDCFMPANTILSIEVLKVEDSSGAAVLELFYEDGKNTYIGFNQVGVKTFLIQKDVAYIKVLAYRNHEYKYIQLEKGTTATPYESYKEQPLTSLTSDRRLTKWDRLVKQDGQIGWLYATKYIEDLAEIIRDNTPIYGTEQKYFNVLFENEKFDYSMKKVVSETGSYKVNKELYTIDVKENTFLIKINADDTIQTAKEHLHYSVMYNTTQTEFVPLPRQEQEAIRALQTYYPTTVVSNSENMEIELSYVADTKNYTDRKTEEAVSAQTQSLANLLSLMPLSTQAAMIEADTNNILDNMEVQK